MVELNEVELSRQLAEDELINPPKVEKGIVPFEDDEYTEQVDHELPEIEYPPTMSGHQL